MYGRIVSFLLSGYMALVLINWSCTKLDTTQIGGDLIPEVDNINTFADTLDVISTQGVFNDTNRLTLFESYTVGKISTDPLFGQTNARLFLQIKPPFYPYYFGQANDTILGVDSVVLCLHYSGFYGDSMTPLRFTVDEVSDQAHGEWDTLRTLRTISYAPATGASLVDQPKQIYIPDLPKFQKIRGGKDSVQNQIRIKLSQAFAQELIQSDTTLVGNGNFKTDSTFRAFNNGFAVSAQTGNALVYTNLTDFQTRLEIHYRRKNGGAPDTTFTYFFFNTGNQAPSRGAVANHIQRNRVGLPNGSQEIYLQTSPGTYANLVVPGLSDYPNRIIHRAELTVEQIPDNPFTDSMFKAPNYLYLDLIDSTTTDPKWKPIYHDLNPSSPYDPDFTSGLPFYPLGGSVDFAYYGGFLRKKADGPQMRNYYQFNITRYVQRISTEGMPNYGIRLFSPQSFSYPQYLSPGTTVAIDNFIPYNNTIAYGRVRVGGGQNMNPSYKMRVRIIYSNVK